MAFGRKKRNQQQDGQAQQSGGERRRFVGREELMKFFAAPQTGFKAEFKNVRFVNMAEELVLKQAAMEAAIEDGTRKDIERVMDDVAFRNEVSNFRGMVKSALRMKKDEGGIDWVGPFDGWFKSYAAEAYSPESEFAKEHGAEVDWNGKMVYITLGGEQAAKHNVLTKWAEFAGMQLIETRKGFRAIYEAVILKMKEGAPKRSTYTNSADHLEAVATHDESIRYFKKTKPDVREWLDGKSPEGTVPGGATPDVDPKVELRKDIEEYRESIAKHRKELGEKTNSGAESAVLSGIMGIIKGTEDELKVAEARLAELEGKKDGADERLARAANLVVDEPVQGHLTGGPTVTGDPEAAMTKAGDTAGKIEAVRAEIERLKTEVAKHEAAAEAKEREAKEKSTAARAETEDDKMEGLLREARVLRTSALASTKAAEDASDRKDEFIAELAKLEAKVMETKPAVDSGKKAAKKAAKDQASTPTAENAPTPATMSVNGNDAVVAKIRLEYAAAIVSGDEKAEKRAFTRLKALGVPVE